MKKIIFIATVLAAELFASSFVQAQGTLYVSNLGQTPTGSAAIGSDAWVAQTVFTGTNPGGYMLNSVHLLMNVASGTPSGFAVSIYSKTGDPYRFNIPGDSPQSSLGSLNGSDPVTGGIFTYTTSGIMLLPSAWYFVVVTATTPVIQGAYDWSAANGVTTGDRWSIQNSYFSSADGSSWTWQPRQDVFQMAINVTAVPEPGTLALAGLSLACLTFWRRRQEK